MSQTTIATTAAFAIAFRASCLSAERIALYRARTMRHAAKAQAWDPAASARYARRANDLIGAVLARRAGRLAGVSGWHLLGQL